MELARAYCSLAFGAALIGWSWAVRRWSFTRGEWLLWNVLATGPLVLSALLVVNFLFHGPVTSAVYEVGRVERIAFGETLRVRVAEGPLSAWPWVLEVSVREAPDRQGHVRVGTAVGALGVPVVLNCELLP
jgi:hypothetical protein